MGQGSVRKPNATVMLKECSNEMTPKSILLYSWISYSLTRQRGFLLPLKETNSETLSWITSREALAHSALEGTFPSNPSVEEEAERV